MILASLRSLSTSSAAELTITPPCGSETHRLVRHRREQRRGGRLGACKPAPQAAEPAGRRGKGGRGQSVGPSYLSAAPGGARGGQAQPGVERAPFHDKCRSHQPTLRLAGSSTLSVCSRGATSTPRSCQQAAIEQAMVGTATSLDSSDAGRQRRGHMATPREGPAIQLGSSSCHSL